MIVLLTGVSTAASFFKLILLLLVFFALLYGAHLFTKWYVKSGYVNGKANNISLVESQQITSGKSIVIARIGKKYVAFVLFKEHATFLCEIPEEELDFSKPEMKEVSFKEVFGKIKNNSLQQRDK